MSDKKTKQARKGQPKRDRAPKGNQAPNPDAARQRVNRAQLDNAVQFLFNRIQELDTRVGNAMKQIWKNDEELKQGMDAAEFNLRAHQKVMNAMAMDLDSVLKTLNQLMSLLVNDAQPLNLVNLRMADVTLPAEDGQEPKVVRRVDWPCYHREVEKDLAILAEVERQKAIAAQKKDAAEKKAEELEKKLTLLADQAKAAGNDPAEVEAAAKELLDRTKVLAEELGKALRGEPFDPNVIAEAEKFINEVEAKEAKEEPPPPPEALPDPNAELPEGASVFGG